MRAWQEVLQALDHPRSALELAARIGTTEPLARLNADRVVARGGAALSGLLVIPLAVPLLIFGAGSLSTGGTSGLALTGACSLVLLAVAPFAAGAAIRSARG